MPVDFDLDGVATNTSLSFNLDEVATKEKIHDHADWAVIQLHFRGIGSEWGSD